uniref:Uncharacterized protein n=1 Tax=Glossina palpalis gambiensis TaxID=67801 RepID=A0A1B0BS59_9MUSC
MLRSIGLYKCEKFSKARWLRKCDISNSSKNEIPASPPPVCGRSQEDGVDVCRPKGYAFSETCPVYHVDECHPKSIPVAEHLSCCCDNALVEEPCTPLRRPPPPKKEKVAHKSMWETIPGYNPCPLPPRLDEIHYQPSDLEKRTYYRTWVECDRLVRKRKFCCFDDVGVPPHCLEKKRPPVESACEEDPQKLKVDLTLLKDCMEATKNRPRPKKSRCIKIVMPFCGKVAKNTKCAAREHKECTKECCPYPSFSECQRQPGRPAPPVECRCQDPVASCEVMKFLSYKKQFQIPPPLPAWPPRPK